MQIAHVPSASKRQRADVILVPMWQGKSKAEIGCEGKEFDSVIKMPTTSGDFSGKEGETLLLYRSGGKEQRVLLVGLGHEKKCLPDTLRRGYAAAMKVMRAKKLKRANLLFPQTELLAREVLVKAIIEGALLASYQFSQLKGESLKEDESAQLSKMTFCGLDKEEVKLLKKAEVVVDAVNLVRDLVNGNADDVNVDKLIHTAKELEKGSDLIKVKVLDKKHLEKEKMGLILAVGQGAAKDPALVIIEYKGDPASKEKTAIVGKGITFDTGGLNLKPTGSMETMKCDMAGAATTLGVLQAASVLKLKKNLIGVLAIAENAIGPLSYKPGDVFCSHAGKTVEITNTDAEGRLVLADALSYLQKEYAPTSIVDLATLTGAIVVALGEDATGLFSNNDLFAKHLIKAGERTHERLWRMPLFPEHKEMLKSSIADLKNSAAGRKAGSSTAAMFLQQFIKDVPWAHLDIAGTAYLSELKPYHTTPATGVGVRLLIDYLEHESGR